MNCVPDGRGGRDEGRPCRRWDERRPGRRREEGWPARWWQRVGRAVAVNVGVGAVWRRRMRVEGGARGDRGAGRRSVAVDPGRRRLEGRPSGARLVTLTRGRDERRPGRRADNRYLVIGRNRLKFKCA